MHKKLFIPGPVDVREEVLAKMAEPMFGHRTPEATQLQERISNKMRKVMFTENTILLSTSSGSGLMEAGVRCLSGKRVAVFSVGAFGDRWYDMAINNGKAADLFKSEPGQPTTPEMVAEALNTGKYDAITVTHNETSSGIMNPCREIGEVVKEYGDIMYLVDSVSSLGGAKVETDAWGIDYLVTSTQKCLGLPPGLSIASISERAYEKAKTVENRGFYFDLVSLYNRVKKDCQYPSTPSLSHYMALDFQLDYILNEEGLENRFARHEAMANTVREWAQKRYELFAREGYRSNTVTCIKNGEDFDFKAVNGELGKRGYTISNGYGPFKNKTFRIAHMADAKPEVLAELLKELDDIIG